MPEKHNNTLTSTSAADIEAARKILREALISTRAVPNGRDFLFPNNDTLVMKPIHILSTSEPRLLFDFVHWGEHILLRVRGSSASQGRIAALLEEAKPTG